MKKSEALKALGLSEGATAEDIKKAHRKLAIENHPDKFGQDSAARAAAEERMKTINEARDVLESGKWDPEFTAGPTPGTPYGNGPYAGYRPTGTGQAGANPFTDFPFGGTTFVWTSYDAQGNPHTYRSDGRTTQTESDSHQNPFNGTNPFAGTGFNPFSGTPFETIFDTETAQEKLAKEQANLKKEAAVMVGKVIAALACCLIGSPALGAYLYVIGSIGWGFYKNLNLLSTLFVIPLVLLALVFAPGPYAAVGIFGVLTLLFALAWDFSDIRESMATIKNLKQQLSD